MSDKILSGAALAAAGVAAASLLAPRAAEAATPTTPVTFYFATPPPTTTNVFQIPGTGDIQILNFALAVETIEAERYRQSIARLTTGGTDDFGNPITGLNLGSDTSANLDVLLVTGFAQTEMQQRDILANTLYGSPAANPFLDKTKYRFDFAINTQDRPTIVTNLSVAETIGVAAYLGGSGLLSVPSAFLAPAASFLGVEARHAASLAYVVNALAGTQVLHTAPLPPGLTSPSDIANILGIPGADQPLTADQILYAKGNISPGLLPASFGGVTPNITGPGGFVFLPPPAG